MANTVDTDPGQQPLAVDSIPVESLPYYERVVLPTIGESNIIEGWRLTENAPPFRGVRALASGTVGSQVTQDVVSGAPEWPRTAFFTQSVGGTVIDTGDPAGGEFDFDSDTDFTYQFWARGENNSKAIGAMVKRAAAGSGPGISIVWVTSTSPDQIQFALYDGSGSSTKSVIDNALSDDTWHMWTLVHDGTAQEIRIWLDGVEQGAPVSTAALGSFANTESFLIGDGEGVLQVFGGFMAHVYILSIVPSQDQIDALFAGGP